MALQQYEASEGSLPPALVADANGTPTHSWRTLIMPHLGPAFLYGTYDMKKPWNDAANRTAAQSRPDVFADPAGDEAGDSSTHFVVVSGPGFAFEDGKTVNSNMAGRALSHTIAVVEWADSGIGWTEPRDVTFEELVQRIKDRSVSHHKDGFHVLLLDGSVWFLNYDGLDATLLRALFTLADDRVLPPVPF
jgi:hypothetical protein